LTGSLPFDMGNFNLHEKQNNIKKEQTLKYNKNFQLFIDQITEGKRGISISDSLSLEMRFLDQIFHEESYNHNEVDCVEFFNNNYYKKVFEVSLTNSKNSFYNWKNKNPKKLKKMSVYELEAEKEKHMEPFCHGYLIYLRLREMDRKRFEGSLKNNTFKFCSPNNNLKQKNRKYLYAFQLFCNEFEIEPNLGNYLKVASTEGWLENYKLLDDLEIRFKESIVDYLYNKYDTFEKIKYLWENQKLLLCFKLIMLYLFFYNLLDPFKNSNNFYNYLMILLIPSYFIFILGFILDKFFIYQNLRRNNYNDSLCFLLYLYKNLFHSKSDEKNSHWLIVQNKNGFKHIEYVTKDFISVEPFYIVDETNFKDFISGNKNEFNCYNVYGYNLVFYFMDIPNFYNGFDNSFNCNAKNDTILHLFVDFKYNFDLAYNQEIYDINRLNLTHIFAVKEFFGEDVNVSKDKMLFSNYLSIHKRNKIIACIAYSNHEIGVSKKSNKFRLRFQEVAIHYHKVLIKYRNIQKENLTPDKVEIPELEYETKEVKNDIYEEVETITKTVKQVPVKKDFSFLQKYIEGDNNSKTIFKMSRVNMNFETLFTEYVDLSGRAYDMKECKKIGIVDPNYMIKKLGKLVDEKWIRPCPFEVKSKERKKYNIEYCLDNYADLFNKLDKQEELPEVYSCPQNNDVFEFGLQLYNDNETLKKIRTQDFEEIEEVHVEIEKVLKGTEKKLVKSSKPKNITVKDWFSNKPTIEFDFKTFCTNLNKKIDRHKRTWDSMVNKKKKILVNKAWNSYVMSERNKLLKKKKEKFADDTNRRYMSWAGERIRPVILSKKEEKRISKNHTFKFNFKNRVEKNLKNLVSPFKVVDNLDPMIAKFCAIDTALRLNIMSSKDFINIENCCTILNGIKEKNRFIRMGYRLNSSFRTGYMKI